METKEIYQKKIDAKLDEWRGDIQKLKAKAKMAEADSQLAFMKQIEALEDKTSAAESKLSELKGAGKDAWHDLKVGVDEATSALGESVREATARFR